MAAGRFDVLPLHKQIIRLMKALGYPSSQSEGGVCNGIAIMALQACSIPGGIEAFNNRLAFLSIFNSGDELIKILKRFGVMPGEDSQVPIKEAVTEEQIELKRKLIDAIAFFDGIELAQSPMKHAEIFVDQKVVQEDIELISQVISSQALEGGFSRIASWNGIYSSTKSTSDRDSTIELPSELDHYFKHILEVASASKVSFSLLMGSPEHAIALHYDANEKSWYLINANELPIHQITPDELPDRVKGALLETGQWVCLEAQLILPKSLVVSSENTTVQDLQKQITRLNENVEFKKLQMITPEKAVAKTSRGHSRITQAIKNGDVVLTQALLDMGVDLDEGTIKEGVRNAILSGHLDVLRLLHQRGANLKDMMIGNKNLALFAVRLEIIPLLRFLKQEVGVDFDQVSEEFDKAGVYNRLTPAEWAAKNGKIEILDALHVIGVDLNTQDAWFKTPAYYAVEYGQVEAIRFMHAHGVDLTWQYRGRSLIWLAIVNDDIPMAECLATLGADLNQVDQEGRTLAMLAAGRGNVGILSMLKEMGVNIHLQNGKGVTPIHVAAEKGQVDVINYLVSQGVDLNQPDGEGYTPAMYAVRGGHADVITALKDAGITIEQLAEQHNGVSLALLAVGYAYPNIITSLKEAGLTAEQLNPFSTFPDPTNEGVLIQATPVMLAGRIGSIEALNAFTEAGVELKLDAHFNPSLLHQAASSNNVQVLNAIIHSGLSKAEWMSHLLEVNESDHLSPIMHILDSKDMRMLQILLEAHIEPAEWFKMLSEADADGNSALFYTASGFNANVVNLIATAGLDLQELQTLFTQCNKEGVSPVLFAAGMSYQEDAKLLDFFLAITDAGVDLSKPDEDWNKILQEVTNNKCQNCVAWLQSPDRVIRLKAAQSRLAPRSDLSAESAVPTSQHGIFSGSVSESQFASSSSPSPPKPK